MVSVELTGGYYSQHVWGASCESHLLVHAQMLVDLRQTASWEDLDRVSVTVLHMSDRLSRNAHLLKLSPQLTIFRQQNN